MYLKIDEEKMKEIQEITQTDYELLGEFLPVDSVDNIIDDLLCEIHHLQEKIQDMEQNIEDNFRPISLKEQINYNERDFIEEL